MSAHPATLLPQTLCILDLGRGFAAGCRALAALGPQLAALSGPLVAALQTAASDASRSPLVAVLSSSSQLLGTCWQLVAEMQLQGKQLQRLAQGLRLLTAAGPAVVQLLAELPWAPERDALLRQAAAQLWADFAGVAALCSATADCPTLPDPVSAEEAVGFLQAMNTLLERGEQACMPCSDMLAHRDFMAESYRGFPSRPTPHSHRPHVLPAEPSLEFDTKWMLYHNCCCCAIAGVARFQPELSSQPGLQAALLAAMAHQLKLVHFVSPQPLRGGAWSRSTWPRFGTERCCLGAGRRTGCLPPRQGRRDYSGVAAAGVLCSSPWQPAELPA